MKLKHKNTFILILISFYLGLSINAESNGSPIPDSSSQIIMVITDYTKSSKGFLTCFERNNKNSNWEMSDLQKIPVVLGTNGLGWGRGLNKTPDILDFPIKKEGDGRSPAGIFKLSSVFGYKKKKKMKNLKMPYIHIEEMTECVDDVNSKYYNMITEKKIRLTRLNPRRSGFNNSTNCRTSHIINKNVKSSKRISISINEKDS